MPAGAIGQQIGRHTKPWRRRTWLEIPREIADFCSFVVIDRLQVRIRNRFDFRREISSGAKTEFRLRRRPDADPRLLPVTRGFDQQSVTGIIVLALVERAQQPDARLDCNNAAFNLYLDHSRIVWTVRLSRGACIAQFSGKVGKLTTAMADGLGRFDQILEQHFSTSKRPPYFAALRNLCVLARTRYIAAGSQRIAGFGGELANTRKISSPVLFSGKVFRTKEEHFGPAENALCQRLDQPLLKARFSSASSKGSRSSTVVHRIWLSTSK